MCSLHLLPKTLALGIALVATALASCSSPTEGDGRGAGKPPEAGYVILQRATVPLRLELPGRTTAFEISDVRPQVSGIVQARLFTEGATVKQGEVLYRIDPRVHEAALAQARADLASAVATRDAAKARAERFAVLAKSGVVSLQDLLDAESVATASAAAVERARAGVTTAEINLQFTRVSAPISGRIGRSIVTTGALVSAGQAEPLATIQRLDPIFVDIQQPSASLTALRRQLAGGGLVRNSAAVDLIMEDGSRYPHAGVLQFAESVVDMNTGTVTLRARFANPEGLLLPGMFVRAAFAPVQATSALLVPQQGISRDARGNATALVIGADSKVELRNVVTERTVGDSWLVSQGLAPGDRVVVEGLTRVRAGQAVTPVEVKLGAAPAGAEGAPAAAVPATAGQG
jgi:membrane fusion protein (multidrug efflux system)